jgi:multidrug efflux pump subunit AcrA (membrane-fusion protein)
VQFSPSSKEWPDYQVQLAKGPMTVTLTTDGDRPQRATGTIIFEDNQVNTKTSTLMLRAEFPNPGGVFRPGIYANVDVVLGDFGDAMVVPERAAFAREADIFVWRVKSDDTVESVAIKPLRADGGELAFNSSRLQVGDRIVVDGIQRLKVGVKVIDMPAAAAPSTGAPAAAPKN